MLPAKGPLRLYLSLKLLHPPKCSSLLPQTRFSSRGSRYFFTTRWDHDCRCSGWELKRFPDLCLHFLPSFPKSNITSILEALQKVPCRSCTCILGWQLLIILLLSCLLITVDFALNWSLIICVSVRQHLWLWIPKGFSNLECNCSLLTGNKLEITHLSASVGKQMKLRMPMKPASRLHFWDLQSMKLSSSLSRKSSMSSSYVPRSVSLKVPLILLAFQPCHCLATAH